jgi:hypothetical protein
MRRLLPLPLPPLQAAKRAVGIYPETKHPSFVDSLQLTCFNGKSFTQAVVDELASSGLPPAPCCAACFACCKHSTCGSTQPLLHIHMW